MFSTQEQRCEKCGWRRFRSDHRTGHPQCQKCGAFAYSINLPKVRSHRPLGLMGLITIVFMMGAAATF